MALAVAGALGLATSARAAVIVTSESGGVQLGQSCGGGGNTAGWKFTVGSADLQATALGEYDAGGDGLGMSVEVGVWDSAGTLLGMVTVPSGTGPTLIGSFRYATLGTPITLAAGQTYTIGSRCTGVSGGGGYAPLDGPTFTFASDFTAAGGRYNNGGMSTTFSEPTMSLGGTILLGPNLEYDLLPTPTPTDTPADTPTATATATVTATPTLAPNGVDCLNGGGCQSGFCVDGVCCDTACTGANQSCNLPQNVGTCAAIPAAAAPTASPLGLLLGVGLLAGVAAAAIRRR